MNAFLLTDEELTQVVRRAQCGACGGMSLRFRRTEDAKGEPISGERTPIDCAECHGNGIMIGLARRYAAEAVAARP